MSYNPKHDSLDPIIVSLVVQIISTLAFSLRCWTRLIIVKKFTSDDWLLAANQVFILIGLPTWFALRDLEQNYAPRSHELFKALAFVPLMMQLFYTVAGICMKASCCVFFLRIAQKRWQRWVYIGTVSFYAVVYLVTALVVLCRCSAFNIPRLQMSNNCSYNWDIVGPMLMLSAVTNAVTDWVFAIIPLWLAIKSTRTGLWHAVLQKPSILLIGMLGISGSIISLVRLGTIDDLKQSPELFETLPKPFMMAFVENAVCATALSLLTIRPLLDHLRRWREGSSPNRPMQTITEMPPVKAASTYSNVTPTLKYWPEDSQMTIESSTILSKTTVSTSWSIDFDTEPLPPTYKSRGLPLRLGILPDSPDMIDDDDDTMSSLTWALPPAPPPSASKSSGSRRLSGSLGGNGTLASISEVEEED